MASDKSFKLTYATMFDPPEKLHTGFEKAVEDLRANLGKEYSMIIDGKERYSEEKKENRSPINTDLVLGIFQRGTEEAANAAVAAAKKAWPAWSTRPWEERVEILRIAADLIDERIFKFGSVLAMEVGKNRMEALADAAETADIIRYCCDAMERNNGYIAKNPSDPLPNHTAINYSVLKPYGVWVVISPFNFPAALQGGPTGAALVAGNTVVMKPAEVTPFTARLLTECFHDAGVPEGAVNYITGQGSKVGQTLVDHPDVKGITFTGSFEVGMGILRSFAERLYPHPVIAEMGGKNPTIVSRNADLERAAQGIYRAAFGLQGQKCSAGSRIFIEEPVYSDLVDRLVEITEGLKIGDPTEKDVFLGPVIHQWAYNDYKQFSEELSQSGAILTGGKVLVEGDMAKGYYCSPTIVADVPMDHRLWEHEMFLPITMVHKVDSLDNAMDLANDSKLALTAGFYGEGEEIDWFFQNIHAGVSYVNRPQGATTGAWPGYQTFGGWKGSGSTGKNAFGNYYLPLYMHEQNQTVIE